MVFRPFRVSDFSFKTGTEFIAVESSEKAPKYFAFDRGDILIFPKIYACVIPNGRVFRILFHGIGDLLVDD